MFCFLQSHEVDNNRDGKNDRLNFEIQVPIKGGENINSVQILLFFDYKLHVGIQKFKLDDFKDSFEASLQPLEIGSQSSSLHKTSTLTLTKYSDCLDKITPMCSSQGLKNFYGFYFFNFLAYLRL